MPRNTHSPSPLRARALACAVAATIALLEPRTPAYAQKIDPDLWVTDAAVRAEALSGNTLYIGGTFSFVGPRTGNGVPVHDASGTALVGFPKVHGTVMAVIGDGSGGWFVGGQFDSVGGVPRSGVAHIRSSLTVAPWNPNSDGTVNCLSRSGSVVYVGGLFTHIGNQDRDNIAALDATTGQATGWNPRANNAVNTLAVSGSTVYAGGAFTNIGGQTRNNIGAIDASSGNATGWNPNADGEVRAIVPSGSVVYIGGAYAGIGGQGRNRLAAVDAATGLATGWNPSPDGPVNAIAVSGATVYVGGSFAGIGGQARSGIAALDDAEGNAKAWDPNPNGEEVRAVVVSGTTIYAAGDFTAIGGQARGRIAALDAGSALATGWVADADGIVNVVSVNGSTIYVGGEFTSAGGRLRNRIAALDLTTGSATSWDPNANLDVAALAVSGSIVYAAGNFTTIGGQSRNRIAALDVANGLATSWDPNANSFVGTLATSGSTVYAGGNFSNIGGLTRNRIAALDPTTGTATTWNPNANGTVQALVVSGTTVYAVGNFTNIGGQTRNRIATLSATTGSASSWNPNASAGVSAVAVSGSTVYAGGSFATIGGQSRNAIAALDANTGLATSWNPTAIGPVSALAVSGSTVYAGGGFSAIGGQARNRLAELDAATGDATAWDPHPDSNIFQLVASGSTVYAGGSFQSMGGVAGRGLAGISTTLGVSRVHPSKGGNAGAITLVVEGNGFQSGAAVTLSRLGRSVIVGSSVDVAVDGTSLTAVFDLSGAQPDAWDVVVTNPDLSFAMLADGFTVEGTMAPQLTVNLIGRDLIRSNRRTAYDVVIENSGNVDAGPVPLWLSGIPSDATVETDFTLSYPPQVAGEPDWSLVPLQFTSDSGGYAPVLIPSVPPGTTVRRFHLTVPPTHPTFTIVASVTPPWADGNKFRGCLSAVVTSPACMGAQLTGINAHLASHPEVEALSGVGVWAKHAWQCEGAVTLQTALAKAEAVLDYMVGPIDVAGSASAGCIDILPPTWRDTLFVALVGSIDPNVKLGAHGSVALNQAIPYSILFENLSSATAPAQQVVVTDPLNVAVVDPATVSLDAITFGSIRIVPPPGLRSYATQVDLRPAKNLLVNVSAAVDLFTGVLSWYFSSIDPATGQPPEDPLAGFLPPNVTPPQGDGSVLFTVMPRAGLGGGALISNGAVVTFDDNAPMNTGAWLNTVDAGAPSSRVLPIAATSDEPSVPIQWAPEGVSPDLHDYTIYVSEDGGPYRTWRLNTTASGDTLVPAKNHVVHSYSFYSVARDLSGNIEGAPAGPDATTTSRTGVEPAASWRLSLEGARPNPAVGAGGLHVWFTLGSSEPATLEVHDVAGRRVARHDVGSLGAGSHHVTLPRSPRLRPGLYFLRLTQGTQRLSARVVAID